MDAKQMAKELVGEVVRILSEEGTSVGARKGWETRKGKVQTKTVRKRRTARLKLLMRMNTRAG